MTAAGWSAPSECKQRSQLKCRMSISHVFASASLASSHARCSLSHASAHDSAALHRMAGFNPKCCAFTAATLGVGGRRADRATTKRVVLGCTAPAAATASSAEAAVSPNEDSPGLARGWVSGLSGASVLKLSELQTMRGLAKSVGARRVASLHLDVQRREIGDFR